jgi:hypothetical protein
MLLMLEAKRLDPKPRGEYRPEASDLACPDSPRETMDFLGRHPNRGMPFGFPALSENEHAILATWLDRGAPGPSASEQAELITPNQADAAQITKWEAFLNRGDPKHVMTARYL